MAQLSTTTVTAIADAISTFDKLGFVVHPSKNCKHVERIYEQNKRYQIKKNFTKLLISFQSPDKPVSKDTILVGTRLTYRTHNCDGLKCDWERPACISYYHSVPDDRSSKLETSITLQVSFDCFYSYMLLIMILWLGYVPPTMGPSSFTAQGTDFSHHLLRPRGVPNPRSYISIARVAVLSSKYTDLKKACGFLGLPMGKFKSFPHISLLLFDIIKTFVTMVTRTTLTYHLPSCMDSIRVFLWFLLSLENRVRLTEGNTNIIVSQYPVFSGGFNGKIQESSKFLRYCLILS